MAPDALGTLSPSSSASLRHYYVAVGSQGDVLVRRMANLSRGEKEMKKYIITGKKCIKIPMQREHHLDAATTTSLVRFPAVSFLLPVFDRGIKKEKERV